MKRMLQLARAKPRYGYRRIGWLLREEGWRAGLSRVFRLWQREGLKVPVKKRKKRRLGSSVNGCHRRRAEAPNDVWCWDFVFDRTASGSQLKWLSVVDEYTRECLALKVDRGITSEDVIDTLSELFAMRGVPWHIRRDNGPEFIAQTLRRWLKLVGVGTLYIKPGSPWKLSATPKASTGGCAMSSWRWRSSRASGMPGPSQPRFLNPHIPWYRKSNPVNCPRGQVAAYAASLRTRRRRLRIQRLARPLPMPRRPSVTGSGTITSWP